MRLGKPPSRSRPLTPGVRQAALPMRLASPAAPDFTRDVADRISRGLYHCSLVLSTKEQKIQGALSRSKARAGKDMHK